MDLHDALAAVVGAPHVIVDADVRLRYETDWHGRRLGAARAVVRPASTAQVTALLEVCATFGAPIVPQGGNTGLVLGGVPRGGEVVLSLERLAAPPVVDLDAATLTAPAGVTLARARHAAREAGAEIGLDLGSRDTATVGGVAATNAGGRMVLRYGSARRRVTGLEAVLGDGRVIRRQRVVKENAGYDLVGLLVGSEGTLGVLTSVSFALAPRPDSRAVALVALDDLGAARRLADRCRAETRAVESAEFFFGDGLALVCAHLRLPPPFPGEHAAYLIMELGGPAGVADRLLALLADTPDVADATVAVSEADAARLWAYRDGHTPAVAAAGTPLKFDVSVPPAALGRFCDAVRRAVAAAAPAARTGVFGHLAEGNAHVNVLGAAAHGEAVAEAVAAAVAAEAGTMSAEHGVGRVKTGWLADCRGAQDLAAMRAVKAALDPHGLLNPGVLFDDAAAGREAEGTS